MCGVLEEKEIQKSGRSFSTKIVIEFCYVIRKDVFVIRSLWKQSFYRVIHSAGLTRFAYELFPIEFEKELCQFMPGSKKIVEI